MHAFGTAAGHPHAKLCSIADTCLACTACTCLQRRLSNTYICKLQSPPTHRHARRSARLSQPHVVPGKQPVLSRRKNPCTDV